MHTNFMGNIKGIIGSSYFVALYGMSTAICFAILEFNTILNDELWQGLALKWDHGLIVLGAFGFFFLSQVLFKRRVSNLLHLIALISAVFFCLLAYTKEVDRLFTLLLFLVSAWLVAESGVFLLERLGVSGSPIWLGFLFAMLILHYCLFVAVMMEISLTITTSIVFVCVLTLGVSQLKSKAKNYALFFQTANLTFTQSTLIFSIFLVWLLAFSAASLPQTFADALVYRLPYLERIINEDSIPFHDYLWAWLIPQPTILQFFPGFLFLGEVGAAWTVTSFYCVLGLGAYWLARALKGSRNIALFSVLVVASNPVIWVFSTAIYNDLVIAAYTIGVLVILLGELQIRSFAVAAAFAAFTATIKLNAGIFLAIFGVLLLLTSSKFRSSCFRAPSVWVFAIAVIVASPWFIWVLSKTGNPFYPFLNSVFGASAAVLPVTVFTSEALQQYGYQFDWQTIVAFPINLTFHTSSFGGLLNGTFGPSLFCLLPLVALGLAQRFSIKLSYEAAFMLSIALGSFLTFLLVAFVTDVMVFRYGISAFAPLICVLCVLLPMFSASETLKSLATLFSAFALVLFLVLVGVRNNYWGGTGIEVFANAISKEAYINRSTHGVQDFINRNTEADEAVIATGFFHVNRLNTRNYFVGHQQALFGNVADIGKTRKFLRDHNVSYWIVDRSGVPAFMFSEEMMSLLSSESIVYAAGNYVVYDVRNNDTDITARYHDVAVQNWRQLESISDQALVVSHLPATHAHIWLEVEEDESILKGSFDVIPLSGASTVIVDQVFYDSGGVEISRSVFSDTISDSRSLDFYSSLPLRSVRVLLVVRPWREIDGEIEILTFEVSTR